MVADPHDVLGVPRGASAAEVQAAYRALARAHHPDAPGGDPERMKAINDAYAALRTGSAVSPPAPAPRPPRPDTGPESRPEMRLPSGKAVAVVLGVLALLVTVLVVLAATGDEVVEPRTATLVASGMRFDVDRLRLAAGAPVEIRLVNRDVGQRHNVAVYRGTVVVARGEPITGPTAVAYDFGPLPAGSYVFRCEIVPGMEGTLDVS